MKYLAASVAPIIAATVDSPDQYPVTNTSVNPARSPGVALYVGDWSTAQLWLFWVAPLIGGALGAVVYRFIGKPDDQS